ncbi:hypothetical protein EDD93_2826 [Streptomyces sp. 840.1]|uniref:hypothetical protein n=1 Tax=Streptomyces sp. 840.1 TaxID=2485152 RepID=UPI000F49FD3E|nr:hypothetical protein [Streptomyces sp. 840.1]ROQ68362.1 hypothetical protein EDD93_2826 [Streptomyces sp. 840.1]
MIPQLVTVGYRRTNGSRRRLHIPLLPVALLLSPLLLLAVPAGLIACRRRFRLSPVSVLRAAWQLLWALPGTRFEIEHGPMAFRISVR